MTDFLFLDCLYGFQSEHVQIPIPSPKKNEILLRIEAASLNPVDWKIQKGEMRPFMPQKFPFTPVTDVAGEVIEVGSGVKEFKVGDKVVSMLNFFKGGGLAEYAVATQRFTVLRPLELTPEDAASLPIAAGTAFQALRSAGVDFTKPSSKISTILITAASGGVGSYAVQLAKLANLHVTATCGARNIDLVKSLGADEVLDYATPAGAALASPSGKKYDVVVHCAAGIEWGAFEKNLSAEGGKVVDVTPSKGTMMRFVLGIVTCAKRRMVPLVYFPRKEEMRFIVGLVKEGKVRSVVDSRHGLGEVEVGWRKSMEGHATGKIVILM